jgi:hypothetical protein
MIPVTDKNRESLVDLYIDKFIEGMTKSDMESFIIEKLYLELDLMTNETLENEISDTFPEILR